MQNRSVKFIIWVLLAASISLTGCTKLTQENYDKIKMGMEYAQVLEILGKADSCDSTAVMKSCAWGDEKRQIKVQFVSDKVVLYTSKGL
jgi:hypothetical protein